MDDARPAPETIRQMFRLQGGKLYWRSRPMSDFKSERAFDIWQRHYARVDIMNIGWKRAWNTNRHRQSIRIDGRRFPVLDVVWCWHHGEWPAGKVTLIDGNPINIDVNNMRCG